jgi:hypothetical protein
MTTPLLPQARLAARDEGARLHPLDRALVLLRLAAPEEAEPAALPLALRDRHLLAQRRATFGDSIACLADCPRCAATQEFTLSATALLAGLEDAPVEPEVLALEGWHLTLRPLRSLDLAAAARAGGPARAEAVLASQALAHAEGPAGEGRDALPAGLWQAIAARVSEREAEAEAALDLRCPECGAEWTASFDIGAIFWKEVEADACRLLAEIATLAERFGWSEQALLAMSPARRRAYLDLLGAA